MKKSLLLIMLPLFNFAQVTQMVKADKLIRYAKQYIGTPYCYANCTPQKGFDCSGFVYYVFGHFKIKVPRASMDYQKQGRAVPPDSARPGDIIVFMGRNIKLKKPGHVGIVVSKPGEEIKFIHASSGKKCIITSYASSSYYKQRFIKIVRMDGVN